MAYLHHKFNDPDAPMPSLVEADEEIWIECVGDCLSNWMQNSQDFFAKQGEKMKTVAMEPFMFAVTVFLPQSWLNILVQGGVLSPYRMSSLDALTEDEHYMLKLAELMFHRCAALVDNKSDIKTILNFIHDVEERPKSLEGIMDIIYAEREVGELQIFKSFWAPIRRSYEKKKSQAKICVIYFFKIIHSQIVSYGREGIDLFDDCKSRYLKRQANVERSFESLNKLGVDAYKVGDNKKAMNYYTQAAWRNPFNQFCFGNRAQTYLNLHEYWNAYLDSKRALIRDPVSAKNWYRQAKACIALGWFDEATTMNKTALKTCHVEVQKVEIVKQKRIIEGHMKKQSELESPSTSENQNSKTQPAYNCQDSINLLSVLGDGCDFYDMGKYRLSVEAWAKALGVFHDKGIKRLQMSEEDQTMLKFVHALTLVKTGIFNNLMSALDKLTALVSQSCKLVALIYGFALVYFKLNRFKEAFQQASKGLQALAKKKSRTAHDCAWLSGSEIASELTEEEMKKRLQHIMEESAHPPKPDAVCRSHQDNLNPRLEIYLTDPDFKGLVRVCCGLCCSVDFHLSCWKAMKAAKHENRNDKMMLDSPCPTPDCGGLIYSIEVYKNASDEPILISSHVKHSPIPKPRRPVIKMKTENLVKLQKKAEKKAIRKQKRMEQREKKKEESVLEIIANDKKKEPTPKAKGKEPTFYKGEATLLVKDDDYEILKSQGKNKSSRNKKKKEKDITPRQTVLPLDVKFKDEGRQLFGAEDFAEDPMMDNSGLLPMPGTAPFPIGDGLLTVPSSIPYPPDELANTLFELFWDILRAHGPQFLGSPFLQDIMKDFPEEARRKIMSYGGLYNFIYSNKKFDIIGGSIVCIKEDAPRAQAMADAVYLGAGIVLNSANGGGYPGWSPAMPPGMMRFTPPSMFPPQPKPTFSWEQRARDLAAKLANAPTSTVTPNSSGTVPVIKSSIIAQDELPTLREALSSTTSKRSRKKSSSSEKSHDSFSAATASTAPTITENKSSKSDDGFTLVYRGGGKKTASSNSKDVSIHDNVSPRDTPNPGVNNVSAGKSSSKSSALDSFSPPKEPAQPGWKGVMDKSVEKQNDLPKDKVKSNTSGVSGLDDFNMPSSAPGNSNGASLVDGKKSASQKLSSTATEADKKGNKGERKRKGKSQDLEIGGSSTSSNSDINMETIEKDKDDVNRVVINDDDTSSVMDSVDDSDDFQQLDDLSDYSRQQLRQRMNGVGVIVEMLKQQQKSSEKTSQPSKKEKPSPQLHQPEILSNLSSLLTGGSGSGSIVGSRQQLTQQQRRDSEVSSPLSQSEDFLQSSLRSDSPALSQGSSESSNQSQPPPLKPLKGMASGMGILSRNKKTKQRLPTPASSKLPPYNLLESQDNAKGVESSRQINQTSDLEADLNNFIYADGNKENKSSGSLEMCGGSFGSGIDASRKWTDLYQRESLTNERKDSSTFFNNNTAIDSIDESAIDPVVLEVFKKFNNEDNTFPSLSPPSSSSSLLNYISAFKSVSETMNSQHSGFSSSVSSQDAMKKTGLSSTAEENVEWQSRKGIEISTSGRGMLNKLRSQNGFVTNGADNMISSPPTDFLNNEEAIKKLWSSSGEVDNDSTSDDKMADYSFAPNFLKGYYEKNLISSSSLQTLSSTALSSFSGLPSAALPSSSSSSTAPMAVFPSMHSQSSSVPHIFDNNVIFPSALENDETGSQKVVGKPGKDCVVQQPSLSSLLSSTFDQSSSSSSHFLSSQFGTPPSLVSTTVSSSLSSLWPQPQFSSQSESTLFPYSSSIFKQNELPVNETFKTGQLSKTVSASLDDGDTVLDHQHLLSFDAAPSPTPSSSSSSSSSLKHKGPQSERVCLLPTPSPKHPNALLPTPNHYTPVNPLNPTSSPGLLNPDVPPYTPNINSNIPTSFNPSAIPFEPSSSAFESKSLTQHMHFNETVTDQDKPEGHYDSTFDNSNHNIDESPLTRNLDIPLAGSSENPEISTPFTSSPLSSSSSLLSRLNPNSREFRPTSYSTLSDSSTPTITAATTTSRVTIAEFHSAVKSADTSSQTEKTDVSSVMTNTTITATMFEEMVEFIKQEARRSQDLRDELDRDEAQLKQSLAAECVLKQKLEDTEKCMEEVKRENEELQEKLDILKDEVNKLEGKNEDLRKHNSIISTHTDMMEKERSRAVTAEKKILQISSQLMGRKLEGKKTEATQHMAQLQNVCGSRTTLTTEMPLTNAERQRRYREKRNADPNRRQEYLKMEQDRYVKDLASGEKSVLSFMSKGLQVPPAITSKQAEWKEFVIKCDRQLDALQSFFSQHIAQLNIGRLLSDLPEVSDKITVPEMPKPPSNADIALPTGDMGIADRGAMPGAKGDNTVNSQTVNAPPGLKPLSKPMPAPLQPRLLGAPGNKFLQKLSQQLPQPGMLPSSMSSLYGQPRRQPTPFDKIVNELQKSFPILTRDVLTTFLEVVRQNNGGSFSNMTVSQVVGAVRDLVLGTPTSPITGPTQQPSQFKMEDLPVITRGDEEDYDNFCPICHEDMDPSTSRTLDCKHVFHEECIRRWFQKQRSCPNCRVFSLLSDDFPSLK